VTTKDNILTMLGREPLTVVQLCKRLGVTRTAVTLQLKQLESAGIVRRTSMKRGDGPGRPGIVYEAVAGKEDVASAAYRPFLLALIAVLKERVRENTRADLFEEAGRRLAQAAGLTNPPDFATGLRAAMEAADALGAATEAEPYGTGVMVRNHKCPLGGAVRGEACVCRALAAFFSAATGRPATERCQRVGRLTCQYLIEANDAGPAEPSSRAVATRMGAGVRRYDRRR
jgi:predicted ArsR family transcriptional regulator